MIALEPVHYLAIGAGSALAARLLWLAARSWLRRALIPRSAVTLTVVVDRGLYEALTAISEAPQVLH